MADLLPFHEFMDHPHFGGDWFGGKPSFDAWRVVARAIFGEPLAGPEQLKIWQEISGQPGYLPTGEMANTAFLCVGRRGGKDVFSCALLTYLSTVGAERYGYLANTVPGETLMAMLFALDKKQASVALKYTRAFFQKPVLKKLVKRETSEGIELVNGIEIGIMVADSASSRGRSVCVGIFDELAHWKGSENSVNPASDVWDAVEPSTSTIPNALLLGISSPHIRSGLFYERVNASYGKPGRTLTIKAPTWVMNPTVPRDGEFLTRQFEENPANFVSEYAAEFRNDLEQFVSLDVVQAAVDAKCFERPPETGKTYHLFIDPAGGSGKDSMTAAVAHCEGEMVILDAVREIKPPFSPQAATAELAEFFKSYVPYGAKVYGDRWGGEWPRELLRSHGIEYRIAPAVRTDLYVHLLPQLNSRRVRLIENQKLVAQLVSLERTNQSGGKLKIDHPQGAGHHDDLANAVAGAVYVATKNLHQKPAKLAGPVFATANGFSTMPGGPTKPQAGQLFVRYNELGTRRELTREEKDDDWREFDRREAEAAKRPPVRQTYFG